MPELRAAKEASSADKVRFIPGRFDENCMRDSGVHSVCGSAGVSFAGTVSDTTQITPLSEWQPIYVTPK